MSRNDSEFDTYYIPPNFIEGGTVMGGLFKLRNVIEAGILALFVGMPIFAREKHMVIYHLDNFFLVYLVPWTDGVTGDGIYCI